MNNSLVKIGTKLLSFAILQWSFYSIILKSLSFLGKNIRLCRVPKVSVLIYEEIYNDDLYEIKLALGKVSE